MQANQNETLLKVSRMKQLPGLLLMWQNVVNLSVNGFNVACTWTMLHKPSKSLDLSSEHVNTFYVPSHPENLDRSNIIRHVDVCLKYTVMSYTCVRKCMHGNMQMPTHPKHVASDNRANKCEQLEHWICCTRLNSFMLLLFGWGWCQWVACHDHLIETQLTQGATKVLQEIMGNYDNFLYKLGSSLGMEAIHAGCHLAREIRILMYPRVFRVATKNGHQLELHNLAGSSRKSDRLNKSTSKDPKEQVILG